MEDNQYEILQKKWDNANSQKSEMQNYIEDGKQKLEEIEKDIFEIDQKKISFVKQKRAILENLEIYNSRLLKIKEEISKLNSLMLEKEYKEENSSQEKEETTIQKEEIAIPKEEKATIKIPEFTPQENNLPNKENINSWEEFVGQKLMGKIGIIIGIIGLIMLFVALAPHFSFSVVSKLIFGYILGIGITISAFVFRKKKLLANSLLLVGSLGNIFLTIYGYHTIMSDYFSLIMMLIFCFGSGIISWLIDGKLLNVFLTLALVAPNAVGYSIGEKTSSAYTYIFSFSLLLMGLLSSIRKDFSHILIVSLITIVFHCSAQIICPNNINFLTFVLPFFSVMLSSLVYIKNANYKIFYSIFLSFWAAYTIAYIVCLKFDYLSILFCSLIIAMSIIYVFYYKLNLEIFKFLFAIFLISIDCLICSLDTQYTAIILVSAKCIEIFAIDIICNKANLLKNYFKDFNSILIIVNSLIIFIMALAYIKDPEKNIQLIGCLIGIVFYYAISFYLKNNLQKKITFFSSIVCLLALDGSCNNQILYFVVGIIAAFLILAIILKKEKSIVYSLIISLTIATNTLIGNFENGTDLVFIAHFVELILFTALEKFKGEKFYNFVGFSILILIGIFAFKYIINYHFSNLNNSIFNQNFFYAISGILALVLMSYNYKDKIQKTISFFFGYACLIALTIFPHINSHNIYQYFVIYSLLIIILTLLAINKKEFWHICVAAVKSIVFLIVCANSLKENLNATIILCLFVLLIISSAIYILKIEKSKIYPYFIAILPSVFSYFIFANNDNCWANFAIICILISLAYFGKKYNKICKLSQKAILIPLILALDFFAIKLFNFSIKQILFVIHSLEIIAIMYFNRNNTNIFYNIISIVLAISNIVIMEMTYNDIVSFSSFNYMLIWMGALGLTIFAFYQKNQITSIIFMMVGLIFIFSNYYFTLDRISIYVYKFYDELVWSISLTSFLYIVANTFKKSSRYNILAIISNIFNILVIILYASKLKKYNLEELQIIRTLFNISIILYCINFYFQKIKDNNLRQLVDIVLSIIIVAISWIELDFYILKNLWISALLAVLALIFFIVGFATKRSHIRYFGIILSGVCAIKLLFYDLSQYALSTKAVVFLGIGAIFLLISKFYKNVIKNK